MNSSVSYGMRKKIVLIYGLFSISQLEAMDSISLERVLDTSDFWVERVIDTNIQFSASSSPTIGRFIKEDVMGLSKPKVKEDKADIPADESRKEDIRRLQQEFNVRREQMYLSEDAQGDSRRRVVDTTQYPYCCVGHLESHFPAISEGNGSGFLIGPHHFLTAAHNLYRRDGKTEDDKWAFACTVTCGRNGQNYKPSDTLEAVSFYIPAKFLQGDAQDAANYDFALIVLRQSIGIQVGWFGCIFYDDTSFLKDHDITITGYPRDWPKDWDAEKKKMIIQAAKTEDGHLTLLPVTVLQDDYLESGTQMVTVSGPLKDAEYHRLFYKIPTAKGSSGSPLWFEDIHSGFVAVGIHTSCEPEQGLFSSMFGVGPGNSAVRITEQKLIQLLKLMDKTEKILVKIPHGPDENPLEQVSPRTRKALLLLGLKRGITQENKKLADK